MAEEHPKRAFSRCRERAGLSSFGRAPHARPLDASNHLAPPQVRVVGRGSGDSECWSGRHPMTNRSDRTVWCESGDICRTDEFDFDGQDAERFFFGPIDAANVR
jgi:hypothetical protein